MRGSLVRPLLRRVIATNSRAAMPGAMPSAAARGVDPAQDAVLIGRSCVADPRTRRRHRAGGDAARSSAGRRVTPASSILIPASLNNAASASYLSGGIRPAAEEAAMRSGHDNGSGMLGADQRSRVERPDRRRLRDQQKGGPRALGRRFAAARAFVAARRRPRGRSCRGRQPSARRGVVGMGDDTARHHVRSVADARGHHGRRPQQERRAPADNRARRCRH